LVAALSSSIGRRGGEEESADSLCCRWPLCCRRPVRLLRRLLQDDILQHEEVALHLIVVLEKNNQCCGSGSGLDPDSIVSLDPDPDPDKNFI